MISNVLSRVFHGCFFVIFGIMFLYILAYQQDLPFALGAALLALAGLVFLYRKAGSREVTDKQLKILRAVILAGMAVLMAVVGWLMLPQLKTDMGAVYYGASEILENGRLSQEMTPYNEMTGITNMTSNEYFVVYPNNIPYLWLITGYYRIVTALGIPMLSDAGIYMGVLLNVAVLLLSVWLGSKIAGKMFGNKGALYYLAVSALFIPYYINASRFYTDTLTLPFPLLAVWLYMKLREKGTVRKKAGLAAALGITLCVGYLIKGSVLIIAAALLVHCLLTAFNRRTFAAIALAAVCFVGINAGWSHYIRNVSWLDMSREEELTFPVQHWIMMSMSGNGGFHQDEFDYTYAFKSKDAKAEADMERLKEKIEGYGSVAGFLNFEFEKMAWTWGDAKFAQQAHLDWTEKETVVNEFTGKDGEYHQIFYIYTSAFILAVYLLFFVSLARGLFTDPDLYTLIPITIFGVLLFFSFWETKSRYLLNYTPLFFLCATDGLRYLTRSMAPVKRKVASVKGQAHAKKDPVTES